MAQLLVTCARCGGKRFHCGPCKSDLCAEYVATLVEFADPPRLEYVTKDSACVYDRIDAQFSVIRDMRTRDIIGFQFIK